MVQDEETKCLVSGDDDAVCQRVRTALLRDALDCPPSHLVPLEVVKDRAARLHPALVVLALGTDHERSLYMLRALRQTVDSYLVVIGPADNSKLILRAMQEGADEYLDENVLEGEIGGAIVRFKAHRSTAAVELEQPGRVISVVASSGGSGASTVAANISAALAKAHGTCGLIDLRMSAGDLAPLFNIRPNYSLAHLAENLERIDEEMFDQLFGRHASGVHLLAAPCGFGVHKVTDRVVRQAIAMARRRFPYVVIDIDRSLGGEQVEALWQSEVILIVVRLDYISLRNTRRTMDYLKELGLDLDRVSLVVNRYGEGQQLSVAAAEESLGKKIVHSIPNDPSRINAAINAGSPVLLRRPFAKISRRLGTLAQSVNGQYANGASSRKQSQ